MTFLVSAATVRAPANRNAGSDSLQLLPDIADPASTLVAAIKLTKELSVQLAKTNVHVECDNGPAPSYSSCRNVLDVMPWDHASRHSDPGGEYPLPFLIPLWG